MKRWFINLQVRKKLNLTFSVFVFFMFFIGWLGYSNMKAVEELLNHVAETNIHEIDLILQIDRDLQQAIVAERTLLSISPDSPNFNNLVKDHNENISQTVDRFKQFKQLSDTPGTKKLIEDFEINREKWVTVTNQIINKIKLNTPESLQSAHTLSLGEGAVKFEEAREKINLLTEVIESHVAEELAISSEDRARATMVMIIAILALVALSVFASLYLSKILVGSLQKAKNMMEELSKGHIRERAVVDGKDETNQMLESMNSFADTLQYSTDVMAKVSKGDLTHTVPELDKKDELTPALNTIIFRLRELRDETEKLTENALAGNLKYRGDDSRFEGGYKEIVKGINSTIDALLVPINEGTGILQLVSGGDLTQKVTGSYKGDHELIKSSINNLSDSLNNMVRQVYDSVNATASASAEISSSAEQMTIGAQEQSSQTAEIASAIEQMTSTIVETTRNITRAAEKSKDAGTTAANGGVVIRETINGMNKIETAVREASDIISKLGESSQQIGQIIQVINDIADQTNLLALNAAIEAARAGEQGRGFAVVADEVRKLAERTSKATGEIAGMITQIQKDTGHAVESIKSGTNEVQNGKGLVEKAGSSLEAIIKSTNEVVEVVTQVAAASEEQSTTAEQISRNIEAISSVTNETASGIQQMANASDDLNRLTEQLQNLISQFRLSSDPGHNQHSLHGHHGNGTGRYLN